MKRIIERIAYNTETALVVMDHSGYILYATPNGNFFITSSEKDMPVSGCLGDPMLEPVSGVMEYLSIIVMDPWEFEDLTGVHPDNKDFFLRIVYSLRISKLIFDRVQSTAKKKGKSVNAFLCDLIQVECI